LFARLWLYRRNPGRRMQTLATAGVMLTGLRRLQGGEPSGHRCGLRAI